MGWRARKLLRSRAPSGHRIAIRLSECERQVAELVAQGHSNKEIGRRLYMSHRTVGSHLYRIFPKLGLRSRVELARIVIERSVYATEMVAS